ncbi:MAG TPA: hypothetical protein VNE00_26505 [Paraburkholderia sp.]|nr:hypothetical protein [Paraburkholderia sp.]
MLIDTTSPVFRQKCRTCVQRSIAFCAAGVVVMAVVTIAALLHQEPAVFTDASSAMVSAQQQQQPAGGGGMYAVVNALSGSEDALVGAIRGAGASAPKMPG